MATSQAHLQDATITVVILTLLAVTFQTILLLNTAWLTIATFESGLSTLPIPWSNTLVVATFVFLTPLYCILVTQLPFPFVQNVKRRLSPLKIHMATLILFVIITMDSLFRMTFAQNPATFPLHPVLRMGQIIAPFFVELFGLGYIQQGIVYWAVAMNTPSEPLDQKTYRINVGEDIVIRIVEGSHLNGYSKVAEKLYEFKKRSAKFVAVALDGDSRSTIISTVPYQMTVDSLRPSIETSEIRNSFINDLEKRLELDAERKKRRRTVKFTPMVDAMDDPVSRRTLELALKRTRPKLAILNEIWGEVPRFHQVAIVLSLLALASILVLYSARIVTDVNTVVSTIIFVVVVLLLDLGIPLREELRRRKEV